MTINKQIAALFMMAGTGIPLIIWATTEVWLGVISPWACALVFVLSAVGIYLNFSRALTLYKTTTKHVQKWAITSLLLAGGLFSLLLFNLVAGKYLWCAGDVVLIWLNWWTGTAWLDKPDATS